MKRQFITALLMALSVTGCFKSNDEQYEHYGKFLVNTELSYGGEVTPERAHVAPGATTQIHIDPIEGYRISTVQGCDGELAGNTYTTGVISSACIVNVTFESTGPTAYPVRATETNTGGTIGPKLMVGEEGSVLQFYVSTDEGFIADVTGCEGQLVGLLYTTGPLATACEVTATFYQEQAGEFVITTVVGSGGKIVPEVMTVAPGSSAQFLLDPGMGFEAIAQGCGGTQQANIFTTDLIEADCEIEVVFNNIIPNSFIITAETEPGGSIRPEIVSVELDTVTQFKVTPPRDQRIYSVNGCEATIDNDNKTITTEPITGHCDLYVTFESDRPEVFIVSAEPSPNGTVLPAKVGVPRGSLTQLSVTPNDGYVADLVTGCDGYLAGNIYTTGEITEHCVIEASFIKAGSDTFVVTSTAGAGGSIHPQGVRIRENGQTSFILEPSAGYGTLSATGCNGTLSGNVYSTGPITDNCVVEATFTPMFTVDALINWPQYAYSTPTSALVMPGDTATFTFNLYNNNAQVFLHSAAGCDGELIGNVYTTGPINSNCIVTAYLRSTGFVHTAYHQHVTYEPQAAFPGINETVTITIRPDSGFIIDDVIGCNGVITSWSETVVLYAVTGQTEDCEVVAIATRP